MNYALLVQSAGALRSYFEDSVLIGFSPLVSASDAFEALRARGIAAEHAMLAATGGVNTHKGAVLLMGLVVHAWARTHRLRRCARREHGIAGGPALVTASELLDEAYRGAHSAIVPEIRNPHRGLSQTYGEWALVRYGWRGIRGVVADRFRLLRDGLRAYARHRHLGRPAALGHLRHYYFSHSEDTNLIKRAGLARTRRLLAHSRALLEKGGINRPDVLREVASVERFMLRHRWSAAGAGDMVATSILLVDLYERGYLRAA